MASTIKDVLIDVLKQQDDKSLQDLINKLITGSDDELELNFKRNIDLVQCAKLVAAQMGNPPVKEPVVIEPPANPEEII